MRLNMKVKILDGIHRAMRAVEEGVAEVNGSGAVPVWLGDVADVDAKQNASSFASEGAKSGEKWPDILQGDGNFKAYKSWKRRNWPGRKLNVWDGRTRDSLTQNGHRHRIVRMNGNIISLGTNSPLARGMQEGKKFSKPKMVYLKEKTPYISHKNKKSNAKIGLSTAGRNWFALWLKEVPARPIVRKSAAQVKQLKIAIAKGIVTQMAMTCRGTAQGTILAAVASQLRADPRA